MDYYIVSSKNCCIFANGNFIGIGDGNLKKFETFENFPFSLQFLPENDNYFPCNLLFDNKNFNETIKGKNNVDKSVKIFNFENGYLFMPCFSLKPKPETKIIFSEEIRKNLYLNVSLDGYYKIFLQLNDNNFVDTLNIEKIYKVDYILKDNILAVKIFGNINIAIIFSILIGVEKIFECKFENVEIINDKLVLLTKEQGITKFCKELIFNTVNPAEKEINFKRSVAIGGLSPLLTPFAFLEELLKNGNFQDYLSNFMKDKQQFIKDFFKNTIAFIPYNGNRENCAVIIKEKAQKIYFEFENNLLKDFYFD